MNFAYVRVSTVEQNEARQTEGLEKFGIDKWFKEKVSAKDTNRPKLKELVEYVREGDTVYVWDFSRLARSTKDLLDLVECIYKKGANLISIKENFDTKKPTGKLMLTLIGAINEFERANLLERQREGIQIAKRLGKYKGRKKIDFPDNWGEVYKAWSRREIKGVDAMKALGLKRNIFYKLVKEYELINQEKNNRETKK